MSAEKDLILSDFDLTLCFSYGYDPEHNNHIPQIDRRIIEAAHDQHLVIATARRGNHPGLPVMWESGLVPMHRPVITENGGCLAFYDTAKDQVDALDLVEAPDRAAIHATQDVIVDGVSEIPTGHSLLFKTGRTMFLARIQTDTGDVQPAHQQLLKAQIDEILDDPNIRVVDTRGSVTIQAAHVSKWSGFMSYLDIMNIDANDAQVTAMGDGENDIEILTAADISIGFSSDVSNYVHYESPGTVEAAELALLAIKHGDFSAMRRTAKPLPAASDTL